MNEPAYLEFIGDRGIRELADAEAFITKKMSPSYEDHGYGMYVVEDNSGRKLGVCGLVKRDYLENPDLGFGFLSQYRGKGLAYQSSKMVLEYACNVLGYNCIHAISLQENIASISLLKKLGFKYERKIEMEDKSRLCLFSFQERS